MCVTENEGAFLSSRHYSYNWLNKTSKTTYIFSLRTISPFYFFFVHSPFYLSHIPLVNNKSIEHFLCAFFSLSQATHSLLCQCICVNCECMWVAFMRVCVNVFVWVSLVVFASPSHFPHSMCSKCSARVSGETISWFFTLFLHVAM